MKKRSFGMVLLVSVLVIVTVLYLVVSNAAKDGGEKLDTDDGPSVYIDRQESEVSKLSYRTGGTEFTVMKSGSTYVLYEDEDFPLDMNIVKFMINAAAKISYSRKINPEGNDLGEYGLKSPQAVIDIAYTDGAKLTLTVGNYNPYSEGYYCTVGDGFVYIIGGEFAEAFAYQYADLILDDRAETPQYGFTSVTKLEISGNGKTVIYERVTDGEGSAWKKNGESGEYYYEVQDIYSELYQLDYDEWVAYNVESDEGFDAYGLKDPAIRVVITHTEVEEIEVEGSASVKKEYERNTAFLIGSPTDSEDENDVRRYFAFGGGKIVYVVSEAEFKNVLGALK